jgi:vitamin B12 transporter
VRPSAVGEDSEGLFLVFLFMKNGIFHTRVGVLPFALLATLSHSGFAQTQPAPVLRETVVAATRVAQPLADLVADVTIVDRAVIERSGAAVISDVLARVPGIEMVRSGGPGSATSVYIRGAESRFTAVFVDGVRVDSQSTGGASWEAIPLSQIDRIEVLRGPAGAVYGSDAMGGVIQIFTRKGEGGFSPYVAVGVGTYGTSKVEMGFSGAEGVLDYSLGLASDASKGFSAQTVATANPDDDGYHNQSASLRLGLNLTAAQKLEVTGLTNDMTSQYDSSTKDDQNLRQLQTLGLGWTGRWSDAYSTTVRVSDSMDRYETTPSPYVTRTNLRGYLFQNEYRMGAQLVTAALERREDQLNNASTAPKDTSRSQNALALGYGWAGSVHTVQFNVRHDKDSEFGSQNTGSAAYGMALTPQWRATASAGSSFRAPTLFQRFSTSGTATLLPETSRNVEMGLRFTEGASTVGVTVYRNMVTNLITFVPKTGTCAQNLPPVSVNSRGCYFNTAEANYKGLTLSAEHQLAQFKLRGSLDLQDPRDGVTGNFLARRATHHAMLGVDTNLGAWSVGADAQLSSKRYDKADNITVLQGYTLINVFAQRRVAKDWTLLLRVDNAANMAYELAGGYATTGRSLYAGLKWAL